MWENIDPEDRARLAALIREVPGVDSVCADHRDDDAMVFRDVSIWQIRELAAHAFLEGVRAARRAVRGETGPLPAEQRHSTSGPADMTAAAIEQARQPLTVIRAQCDFLKWRITTGGAMAGDLLDDIETISAATTRLKEFYAAAERRRKGVTP